MNGTEHFIKEKVDVEDKDKTMTFGKGKAGRPARFVRGESNIFLMGLSGSGKSAVGQGLAERMGASFVELAEPGAVDEACAAKGTVFAVDQAVVESEAARTALKANGLLFYLVADVPLLLQRLGDESRREALAADMVRLEPAFMDAHLILRANQKLSSVIKDAAFTLEMM